jgi:hypothetical protein
MAKKIPKSVLIERVRLTIPAREALERAGNRVTATGDCYSIWLSMPPRGLVIVTAPDLDGPNPRVHVTAVRRRDEPPYPGERVADMWTRHEFSACPQCGAAIVWAEAGFVPGWRMCVQGGHALRISDDGTRLTREPDHDIGTRTVMLWEA